MRLNEDYFNDIDTMVQDSDSVETQVQRYPDICELQAQRPVSEILSGYNLILEITIEMFGDLDDVENYVYGFSKRLKDRLDYFWALDASKVIIGSRLNGRDFDRAENTTGKESGFFYYDKYIMLQTRDDHGIQNVTQLYIGLKLKGRPNYIRAYMALKTIIKMVQKLSPSLDYVEFIIRDSTFHRCLFSDEYTPDYKLRKALEAAEDKSGPNSAPIDAFKEVLCCLYGQSYKDSWKLDHNSFIRQMHEALDKK